MRPASALRTLFALAAFGLLLHILTNGHYGFHRDELATLDDARHLAWGYVAYPPFAPLVARKLETGARYHAVAGEGVPLRDIAEVIGRGLKVPVIFVSPEEDPARFGWLAAFAGRDLPASARSPRKGWRGARPGLD